MRYRKFGDSDLEVSEICFGPMQFAAKEPAKDDTSLAGQRTLSRAIDREVTKQVATDGGRLGQRRDDAHAATAG